MAPPDSSHRRTLLDERCARHQFEAGVDLCRQCGFAFCGECLVYSFGERQPPFCIPCALAASGVRSGAARAPAMPKKELRRREKEAKRAAKIAADAAATQAAVPEIDWSLPINGNSNRNGNGQINGIGQINGNGQINGDGSGSGEGHPDAAEDDGSGEGAPPPPPTSDGAYPTFEDVPSAGRPQAPVTPPKATPRGGMFRKKNKVVPF
jgi:hypothetical protein